MKPAVVCIGAAHLDRKAHARQPVVLGSSNPVRTRTAPGGVARNVAEGLARLGVATSLVSRVGRDPEGDRVLAQAREAGVEVSYVTRSTARPTASYTALLAPGGELVVALADMDVYEELDADAVAALLPALGEARSWVVDCNLPAAALRRLLEARPVGIELYVDPVSVLKARRLEGLLDRVGTLFCNADEAAALAGLEPGAEPGMAMARLRALGVDRVVVTRGAQGAGLLDGSEALSLPALEAEVVDVTGAGDALIAGFVHARQLGAEADEALRQGLACAALTVESPHTVDPGLTAARVRARAGLQTGEPR